MLKAGGIVPGNAGTQVVSTVPPW